MLAYDSYNITMYEMNKMNKMTFKTYTYPKTINTDSFVQLTYKVEC